VLDKIYASAGVPTLHVPRKQHRNGEGAQPGTICKSLQQKTFKIQLFLHRLLYATFSFELSEAIFHLLAINDIKEILIL
jgi:hypothetical protein